MKKRAAWLAACMICMAVSIQAKPRGEEDHKERGHDARARGERSLDESVARVRRETRGRVLSADTEQRDGESVHRIKVLTPDGRVRVLTIDEDE